MQPPAATHRSHSANVTFAAAYGEVFVNADVVNWLLGRLELDPMSNSPEGTMTSSAQSGQSRNSSPGKTLLISSRSG